MRRSVVVLGVLGTVVSGLLAAPAQASPPVQVGGSDNVETSVLWSRLRFADDAAPVVILGRADNFGDALGAGALAGSPTGPAPFLVTPTGSLDDRVTAELARLGTDLVRIVGGSVAVSPDVEAELQERGYRTQRLAGPNRISTAVEVATDARDADGEPVHPAPPVVLLARAYGTGTSAFADALGGGMLGGANGAPLLLTDTPSLPAETLAYLDGLAERPTIWILGGTAAVSQGVEDHLGGRGYTVQRLAGTDRFATAARIAVDSFDATSPDSVVALVDGFHADSWLSGFAASSFRGGAVLLSHGDELPAETRSALERIGEATPGTTSLYCAPQVSYDACTAAEATLNG